MPLVTVYLYTRRKRPEDAFLREHRPECHESRVYLTINFVSDMRFGLVGMYQRQSEGITEGSLESLQRHQTQDSFRGLSSGHIHVVNLG